MQGYIAVVRRHSNERYEAVFPDLPITGCTEQSVDEALYRAQCELNLLARSEGTNLPEPRGAHEMLGEAARCDAVAAICMLPRLN